MPLEDFQTFENTKYWLQENQNAYCTYKSLDTASGFHRPSTSFLQPAKPCRNDRVVADKNEHRRPVHALSSGFGFVMKTVQDGAAMDFPMCSRTFFAFHYQGSGLL